jgi:hypothetical protein
MRNDNIVSCLSKTQMSNIVESAQVICSICADGKAANTQSGPPQKITHEHEKPLGSSSRQMLRLHGKKHEDGMAVL